MRVRSMVAMGFVGLDVLSWRICVAYRDLYECEGCAVLRWVRWCRLKLARL